MDEVKYRYRIVVDVVGDEEWEPQEILDYVLYTTPEEAEAKRKEIDLSRYPKGSGTYIEVQSWTPWRRLRV